VATQKDLQTERTKADVVGMGSYNSDSHNVQRFVNEQGFVETKGTSKCPYSPTPDSLPLAATDSGTR